jgi:nicotinamidase-related amidase
MRTLLALLATSLLASPAAGESVVGKHHANAFRDTDLLAVLRRIGATRLVIAGMQTHMCVEAATRAAALAAMDGSYARVVSTDELLAGLE